MPRASMLSGLGIRSIYAACLLVATCNHAVPLIQHGLYWDYGGESRLTTIFWTSLAFADPLAAVMLFALPRIGLALTTAIIVLDVMHNAVAFKPLLLGPSWGHLWTYSAFGLQITFLVLVLATVRSAWSQLPSRLRS